MIELRLFKQQPKSKPVDSQPVRGVMSQPAPWPRGDIQ